MIRTLQQLRLLGALLITITALTATALLPYGGDLTALFHMDEQLSRQHILPNDFIVLSVPGYDGMQYYQIARNIPKLFTGEGREEIRTRSPGSYAYQRILFPASAFLLSKGQDQILPIAFLLINVVSLLAAAAVLLKWTGGKGLYSFALALCPGATVALHFSLAEPLSLLFLTMILIRYLARHRLTAIDAVLLSLFVLTKEVNLAFPILLLCWTVAKRRWRDLLPLLCSLAVFLAWHGIIFAIFEEIPFLWSAEKNALPLVAAWEVLSGARGFNHFTLSSIALLCLFVVPTLLCTLAEVLQQKKLEFIPTMLLSFLGLMLVMPDHIWGSITSIGRVITPVYPLALLSFARHDTVLHRFLAIAILALGLGTGIGLALIAHPFRLS